MDDFEDFLNDTPVKDKTVGSDSVPPRDASIDISASKNCFTLDDEDDFLSDTSPVTPKQAKCTPDNDGFDDLFNFDSPKISDSIPTDSQDPDIPDSITESVADMESNIDLKTVEAEVNDEDEKTSDVALITVDSQNADILDDITESVADMQSNIDSKPVEVEDNDKDEKDSNVALITAESQATDILDDITRIAADTKMNMDFEAIEDNDKDEKTSNIGIVTPKSYVADVSGNIIEININSKLDSQVIDIVDDTKDNTEHPKNDTESEVVDDNNEDKLFDTKIINNEEILKDENVDKKSDEIIFTPVRSDLADPWGEDAIDNNMNVDEKTADSSIFGDKNIVTPVKSENDDLKSENADVKSDNVDLKPENVDPWGDYEIDSNIASSQVVTTPQTPYGDDYDELFGSPSAVSSILKDPVTSTKEITGNMEEQSSLNSIPVTPSTKKTSDDDDDFMSWLGDSSPTPSKPPATPAQPTTTNNEASTPIVQDSKNTTSIKTDKANGDNIVVTPTQVKVKALMDNFFDDLFGGDSAQGTPKLTRATLARVVPPDDFEKKVEDVINSGCDILLLRSLLIEGGYVPSQSRYLL